MFYARNLPRALRVLHSNIYPKYGKGTWIYGTDDKKYLDFTSGIGALSTGHSHPFVLANVQKQLQNYVHMPQQVFNIHTASNTLTKKLLQIFPDPSLNSIFYVNSGSEATDNAIKIARAYTKKQNIITITRGFHGRTYGAISITSSNLTCKKQTHPFVPGVYFCQPNNIDNFFELMNHQTSYNDVACVIYEPVQGEGGIYSLDQAFLHSIHAFCKNKNILTIADEVQCGFGRTGTYWNVEQKEIVPDILTFGKGIASGFPLAGLVTKKEITDNIGENFLGGTYGGNAICCAAASATIEVFKNENILSNTEKMGKFLKEELSNMTFVVSVRQYGLMIAVELIFSDIPEKVKSFIKKLNNSNNVLVLSCGNNGQYVRLLPPLNVTKKECEIFLDAFKKTLLDF